MGFWLHWESCVFQLYQLNVNSWISKVSSLENTKHVFFFLSLCPGTELAINMIHVIIWHVEQWFGEWELRSTRHRSVIAKNVTVRGGETWSFSPFTQRERCWQDEEKERPQIIPPLMEENVRGITACLQLFRLPSNKCLLSMAHLNLAVRNQDDVILMPRGQGAVK